MAERVADILNVEIEHGLGERDGPFVVLRVVVDGGGVGLAQLPPAQAREIAGYLLESAARAEYESDLHDELVRRLGDKTPDSLLGLVFTSARAGEHRRHTKIDG